MFVATAYRYTPYYDPKGGAVLHTEQHTDRNHAAQKLANHFGLTTQLWSYFKRDGYLYYRDSTDRPHISVPYFNVYMEVKEVN